MFAIIRYIKMKRYLDKIYKEENLIENLSRLFGANFRKDWFGRLYAVLNPYVFNGKYVPNQDIIEYTEQGISRRAYIENWVAERMVAASQFIINNQMFDLVVPEIKPINKYVDYYQDLDQAAKYLADMNFLFVLKPSLFNDMVRGLKITGIVTIVAVIAIISLLILI